MSQLINEAAYRMDFAISPIQACNTGTAGTIPTAQLTEQTVLIYSINSCKFEEHWQHCVCQQVAFRSPKHTQFVWLFSSYFLCSITRFDDADSSSSINQVQTSGQNGAPFQTLLFPTGRYSTPKLNRTEVHFPQFCVYYSVPVEVSTLDNGTL